MRKYREKKKLRGESPPSATPRTDRIVAGEGKRSEHVPDKNNIPASVKVDASFAAHDRRTRIGRLQNQLLSTTQHLAVDRFWQDERGRFSLLCDEITKESSTLSNAGFEDAFERLTRQYDKVMLYSRFAYLINSELGKKLADRGLGWNEYLEIYERDIRNNHVYLQQKAELFGVSVEDLKKLPQQLPTVDQMVWNSVSRRIAELARS